ncbi:MAG: YczI family protein [Alkalibacterium sp.]|nr:YczI family protein [Alkalibacterium sp.]
MSDKIPTFKGNGLTENRGMSYKSNCNTELVSNWTNRHDFTGQVVAYGRDRKREEEVILLKVLHNIFSIIVLVIAAYSLIYQNFEFQHYMMFFLALTMLIMGLKEFKEERKLAGWTYIGVFIFVLLVSIQGFLLG